MTPDDRAWYANRRVLVTGHTGFKGAWLSLWLQDMGAIVQGYALAPGQPSLFELAGVGEGMGSTIADIRDYERLKNAVLAFEPEVVFHLAAKALVRESYDDPVGTFDTNVIGTANLLNAMRVAPSVRAVVIVTSDKCYENVASERPFREDDPMGGSDPYSASKGCAELVTTSFARSYFQNGHTAIASARAGNVIGGGDWGADRIVPDLVRSVMISEPARIRRPDAVRPWQFVLEPLRGYLVLARQLADRGARYSGAWNFGPTYADMVSVRTLVQGIQDLWPALSVEFAQGSEGPHEASILRLDCTKARNELGWKPELDVQETITKTVAWYRSMHEQLADVRQVTLDQLRSYDQRFIKHGRGF